MTIIREFTVKGTTSTYHAVEIGSSIDTSNFDGESSVRGLSSFRLTDGRALNYIDENMFLLVQTGEVLRVVKA